MGTNILLKETYLAGWNLLHQLLISYHFFLLLGGRGVVRGVANKQLIFGEHLDPPN